MIHSLALVEVTQNLREHKIACHQLRDRRRGEQDRNARIWQSTAGLTEGGEVISETAGKSCDTPPSNTDHVIIGSSVRYYYPYLSCFQCACSTIGGFHKSGKGLLWLILVSYLRSAVTVQVDYILWMPAPLNPSF